MTAPALKVHKLSKRYGGVHALRDVDLQVEVGEVHGIIGPNGAGKSTLVDVISGFTPRSDGTIEIDGNPINGRPHQLARAGIIRTFQHTSLFQGVSVEDNLRIAASCMGRRRRGPSRTGEPRQAPGHAAAADLSSSASARIVELLELTNLADVSGSPAESLSYGAQRRLAIAIALMGDPRILLLDEPAAGMNPVESAELVALVQDIAQARTVVLIEHDMSVIRALCRRSTVLVDGQVLTTGSTDEVLDDRRVVDVYLGVSA